MNLSVIILTHNEEIHIERCIRSLNSISDKVFVIDSFSNDRTEEIAKNLGATVHKKKWPGNHSEQLNWAIENCDIKTKWVMRLDADEIISLELAEEINRELSKNESIKGFFLKRGHIFLGRKILHGGNFPIKLLRIWEHGFGSCEKKLMDEHIVLKRDCKTKLLKHAFWDNNLKDISWWTDKHNSYATKEAIMQIQNKHSKTQFHKHTLKKFFKHSIYERLPLTIRAFMFFCFRYIFRLGFLDGYQGLVWNFLQGFWYRFLVDVKVYEIEKRVEKSNLSFKEIVKIDYDFDL